MTAKGNRDNRDESGKTGHKVTIAVAVIGAAATIIAAIVANQAGKSQGQASASASPATTVTVTRSLGSTALPSPADTETEAISPNPAQSDSGDGMEVVNEPVTMRITPQGCNPGGGGRVDLDEPRKSPEYGADLIYASCTEDRPILKFYRNSISVVEKASSGSECSRAIQLDGTGMTIYPKEGLLICATTDSRNIALITVGKVGADRSVMITFQVWRRAQ